MAITPGKCPPPPVGCPPFTQKDCIEVFKIYDQCVREDLAGTCVVITNTKCPGVHLDTAEIRSCTADPATAQCKVLGFGAFNPPFFRSVFIQQSVDVRVTLADARGKSATVTLTLQAFNEAYLWTPPGTLVQCTILGVGDCACEITARETDPTLTICCRVQLCQELQVKAKVKLLVPAYGFCEAPLCVQEPLTEIPCPQQPLFPPQRCQEPPTAAIQDIDGVGIAGINVTLTRTFDSTVHVQSFLTGTDGVATFVDKGGFEAGFDVLSFTDPVTSKTYSFPIPFEFTDSSGTAHDSATACVVIFRRTDTLGVYEVFIDGYLSTILLDP
jgi:hypothetical protein